jgi:hypothetical protein
MKEFLDEHGTRIYVAAAAFATTALTVYALVAPFHDPD